MEAHFISFFNKFIGLLPIEKNKLHLFRTISLSAKRRQAKGKEKS